MGEHEIERLANRGKRRGGMGEENVVSGTIRGKGRRGNFEHVIEEREGVIECGD